MKTSHPDRQDPTSRGRRGFIKRAGAGIAAATLPLPGGHARAAPAGASPETAGEGPMAHWTSTSPALTRAFAPVFDERDDGDLPVQGEIPAGLSGVFMRNGPNPAFEPAAHYAYPFDGTGMVHAIYLDGGRARYRNRWVATKELTEERAAGHRIYNTSFGPPPHANLANTNIVHHAGRYLALYEGGAPYEMDRELATVGAFDYGGALPRFMSAHPKADPQTGELLSVEYDLHTSMMRYLRADRSGQLDRRVAFSSPWPAIVHDVAITERYVVAVVAPLVFDMSGKGPPAQWEPDRGTRIALIPRDAVDSKDIKWVPGPPFFNWHTVNAYEEGGRIELVVPWYDAFSLTAPSKRLELHRLTIDVDSKQVDDRALDDQACEFGRINDACVGRRARYGYVGLRAAYPAHPPQIGAFEAFARYDLDTGEKVVHRFPPGQTVCEPVFVADPAGGGEADGYILSFVHVEGDERGHFVILDARNLAAEPVATVMLPRRVPAGLHGSWTPV
ncbi:carotenoid oxygenase family protein [Bordetella genomosp. 9]|nr:carotenoid oxygenase family protein [Bordetella genomosp. 9]